MLKLAYKYQQELNKKYSEIIFQDRYKWWNNGACWDYSKEMDKDSYNKLQLVSVDKDNNVLGFLEAIVDRTNNRISSISLMNFGKISHEFSKDVLRFIYFLFMKQNFRKINFHVIVGNPAELIYDKFVNKYGGRVVGTFKEDVKLEDGMFYDNKHYELFRDDYIECK